VFVVATANDIAVLPPEFLRRGRFDEIFSVDFPTEAERVQILEIHLKKALKHDLDEETKNGLAELSKKMDGYAGSDIASLVNSAMETLWNNPGQSTTMLETFETLREYIKPLKEVLKEKIEKNREKFGEYKLTSASFDKQSYDMDSKSGDPGKRAAVAADPRCPETYLRRLAKDPEKEVLLALVNNPECPENVITDLLDSVFDDVKARANERYPETDAGRMKYAKSGTKEQKLAVMKDIGKIKNDGKRDEILCILAEDGDREVRMSILDYPYVPKKAWSKLLVNVSPSDVLSDPRCPRTMIEDILSRESSFSDAAFISALETDAGVDVIREVIKKNGFSGIDITISNLICDVMLSFRSGLVVDIPRLVRLYMYGYDFHTPYSIRIEKAVERGLER
jgi:hypothetical protein